MKKACIYDIGNCFIFNVKVFKEDRVSDIEDSILDIKASALLCGDVLYSPYDEGNISVFLFHTYSRKAYDLYHKLNGSDMRALDPFCVQRILYSIGVFDCREPMIYELKPIQVKGKEKILCRV